MEGQCQQAHHEHNNQEDQEQLNENNSIKDQMIQLQGSIVNKVIKQTYPETIVSSEFKKHFKKTLSLFILYLQSAQTKKRYDKNDVLEFLQREGFGKIAEDIRMDTPIPNESNRKKVPILQTTQNVHDIVRLTQQ